MRLRKLGPLAVMAIIFGGSDAARAQPAPSGAGTAARTGGDFTKADDLYRRGNLAYDAGKLDEAYALYSEAFALKKSYDIAGNLGQTEFRLGKFVAAAEHLSYSLSIYPPNGNPTARKKQEEMLADARKQVGRLQIQVNVEGASVLIDGKEVGRSPLPLELFVSPGPHQVEARKEGYKADRRGPNVKLGESTAFSLTLEKDDSATVGPPSGEKPVWPTVLLASVGAAGLGVGIATLVVGAQKHGEAEEHDQSAACATLDAACVNAGDALLDDARMFQGVGIAMTTLGGLALAGMITYLAIPGEAPADEDGAKSATIRPFAADADVGVTLQLEF